MSTVTIAIPVYKRLHYLAGALETVAAQDYGNLDVIVSDNGTNGPEVEHIVQTHYPRPYRFRRNPKTVGIVEHYNQLVEAAEGEYFVLLADDDELAPNYVSALVGVLGAEPDVGAALGDIQVIDEAGAVVPRRPATKPPERMTGPEFVRIWCRGEYPFVCFTTMMARTHEIRQAGGYPPFPKGTSVDNFLLFKLCLDRRIAFEPATTFRYRVYESSHGLALGHRELARDLRAFLDLLDSDPELQAFARERPVEWREVREHLRSMTWRTYRYRWYNMYRHRMSAPEWIRAAFTMPFIPAYYRKVSAGLLKQGLAACKRTLVR